MRGFKNFGVIDIGNSGLKLALADRSQGLKLAGLQTLYWAYPSDLQKSPPSEWTANRANHRASIDDQDAIGAVFAKCRKSVSFDGDVNWIIGSVQPNALHSVQQTLNRSFPKDSFRSLTYHDIRLPLQVDAPEHVGIDRLLAASEAWHSSNRRGPMVVVQAGTAITVDWLDANGVFQGGAIIPGISLTLKYLALGTAQLPWLAPPADPRSVHVPGKNTRDAILAGVSASVLGGITRLIETYRDQYAEDRELIQLVLSGGDGAWLSSSLNMPHRLIEHLVLRGLARHGNDVATAEE